MKFIADLHIHSKHSRATSKELNFKNLDKFAQIKGIQVIGTGDFTHPDWIKEISKLEPAESGLFKLNNTRFLLSSEISCIYKKNDKVRKIHVVIFAPSIETVKKINKKLDKNYNIRSDGRPILGLDVKELLKIILDIDQDCMMIPAHILTPWFAIFGSKSGFDSVEECFEDYSKYIYALETGLSADPRMIWRIPDGRKLTLLSNSDAHSAPKIGREANVFDTDLSYKGITEAIKTKKGFLSTIEFYPEEGKYHYDGHRACDISLNPIQSKKYNNICPTCGKPLTLGVVHRVDMLADKKEGFIPDNAIPFKSIVPLREIIAESYNCGVSTKKVDEAYDKLIELDSEFNLLLDRSLNDLKEVTEEEIALGIIKVRKGEVNIEPGYDGVFGKVRIFSNIEKKKQINQETLI
jgi:uncharacterized protein (TIGR00375 family)